MDLFCSLANNDTDVVFPGVDFQTIHDCQQEWNVLCAQIDHNAYVDIFASKHAWSSGLKRWNNKKISETTMFYNRAFVVNSTTVFYFLFSGAAFDGLIIRDMRVTGSV